MPEVEKANAIIKDIAFSSGDVQLKGTLHLPMHASSPPVVIGSHGLFSDRNSPKQRVLADKCATQGIAFFRFDHRGCGGSEGVFKDVTNLENRRKDLLSAIAVLREMDETGNTLGLFGSSLGGAVVLSVALETGAGAVVTYAAPLTGARIVQMLKKREDAMDHPEVDPEMLHFDISGKIEGITGILIIHGDSDTIVPPSEAHRIYTRAKMPKHLIMLKNGDHPMSLPENQEKFAREAASWFKERIR
ncbi:alpha/beta hydrolase [Desulfococcus sp.]|uniref:alpha/beta hydrolase n=1 Tax=Desulfococcus sp. TaxID=2025834 RepID=UPI003592F69F